MEIAEAIKFLEDEDGEWWGYCCPVPVSDCGDKADFREALDMAIAALRAQQEAEKNEALTLDELREMDTKPVYVIAKEGSGWAIVDWHGVNKSWMYFSKTGTAEGMSAKAVFAHDYGAGWLAFRHPPKEAQHGD